MPDAMVTLAVPSAHVPVLREIALEDFDGAVHVLPDQFGDDHRAQVALVDEVAALVDQLGWDAPAVGDHAISVRPTYLRNLLWAAIGCAAPPLVDDRGSLTERRDALRRLRCCVTVFEALEEGNR